MPSSGPHPSSWAGGVRGLWWAVLSLSARPLSRSSRRTAISLPDIWRPVPTACGYLVSWTGHVIGPSGVQLAQSWNGKYMRVSVGKHRDRKSVAVHQLVASAFLGPKPQGLQVLHADDNGRNNWLGNISYGTAKQNAETRLHANSKKDRCPNEHLYTDENTYWHRGRYRHCRACDRERKRSSRERQR